MADVKDILGIQKGSGGVIKGKKEAKAKPVKPKGMSRCVVLTSSSPYPPPPTHPLSLPLPRGLPRRPYLPAPSLHSRTLTQISRFYIFRVALVRPLRCWTGLTPSKRRSSSRPPNPRRTPRKPSARQSAWSGRTRTFVIVLARNPGRRTRGV